MSKFGIITTEKEPTVLLLLLHELGVENPLVETNTAELENHFMLSVCDWLIIDDEQLSFSFLQQAIKNGCHLLFLQLPTWTASEMQQLIKLTEESKVSILFHNEMFYFPQQLKHIQTQDKATLVDCYLDLKQPDSAELFLRHILLLLVQLDDSNWSHISLLNIPPVRCELYFRLQADTHLRILLRLNAAENSSGYIKVYCAHEEPFSVSLTNSVSSLERALREVIQPSDTLPPLLPNLLQYAQAQKMLQAAQQKRNYSAFFGNSSQSSS